MSISQKELNKVRAATALIENGDMAVVEKLIEFMDFIEDLSESRTLEVENMDEMVKEFEDIKKECEDCMSEMDGSMESYKEELTSKLNEAQALLDKVTALETTNKSQIDLLDKRLTNEITAVKASIPSPKDMTAYNAELKRIESSIPKIPEQIKETPEELRDKLESIVPEDEKLSIDSIGHLREELQSIKSVKGTTGGGMFGLKQMRMVSFSFSGNDSTTVFYLPKEPGAKGLAIWAYYQGQHLQLRTHFTVSGKTFTCVGFTPQTGSVIEGFIII
jgi:predicted  nucleic acid-binding Zn-ribbon protein